MGTDVRKLALDGFTATRVIGCDLRREFIEAGYTLFGDRASCGISFFSDDIFDLSPEPANMTARPSTVPLKEVASLKDLQGRLTYIYTGALFHLFDEQTQSALAARLVSLLRVPTDASLGDRPVRGCVIFGRHQGKRVAGIIDADMGRYACIIIHRTASFD